MRSVRRQTSRAQIDKLHQAIAALEAQQRELNLDFTQQIAELQQRLRDMGVVVQHGAGAMAVTGGVAAGAGGMAVGGDVAGNVFIGSTLTITSGRYTGPSTNDSSEAIAIYRRVLVDGCRHMSLRGLDVDASDPTGSQKRFDLAQVYVDLHTTTQVPLTNKGKRRRTERTLSAERETRPLRVLEAVVDQRHVVLLGNPGSGKSTFVTHLALCLSTHALEPRKNWLARLTGWPQQEADLVPVTVVLRDFARWLPPMAKKAEPRHLWNFIVDRLKAQNLAFVAKPLLERLEHGGAILLLDGLDEIPTQRHRTFIRDAVAAFATRYSQCRVLVTCRTFSYQDPAWQLSDFQSFTLAPFSAEQIDRFIAAWHDELARLGTIKLGAIEGASRQLQAAVRRPDLWRLASNPLLLTVMALVHIHKGQLPEARALLYEETIDILLWRWEQVKASGEDEAPPLRQLLAQANRTDVDMKRALWRLAFEAHREGGTTDAEAVADIGESRLNKTLIELHPDKSRDWAHQMVKVMKLRAGLLLERVPEVYTFPHRTFQEYLAGAHLSIQSDFAQQGSRVAAEGAFWHQVVLLAVGRLVHLNGETAKPLALVAELCPADIVDTEVGWRQAWLAGEALLEMGLNRVEESSLGRELVARVRGRLVQLLQGGHLSPVERAAAGDTLARMGDLRFRADAWYLPAEPLLGFIEIPAGPFLMGSTKYDQEALADEMPQHKPSLPGYYIAHYPVTVAQFRAFVDASGYIPEAENSLHGRLNHPVVDITWYEAIKYCQWLTERLREWEGTPEPLASLLQQEGWQMSLPSEAEWEKAARGTDGRPYPWGTTSDPARANCYDTRIGSKSAVGCFPTGASPSDCLDMAGNVWEWTRSLWGSDLGKPKYTYPYKPKDGREHLDVPPDVARVLRGGGFRNLMEVLRCAYRIWGDPNDSRGNLGFRVVVRPCR